MAKVSSIFKIQGTLGGLTFYKDQSNTYRVREKSSLDKERVMLDPAFERTRENSREFGSANTAGTLLRRGAALFLKNARDPGLAPRMLSALCKVKDWDLESVRGKRTVGKGLLHPEGRQLLKGFDFNKDAPLHNLLHCPYTLKSNFVFHIPSLVPRKMLHAPKVATHATFRSCVILADFETGTTTTAYSPAVLIPLNQQSIDLTVVPDTVPTGDGILFWLLLVEFSQELNGLHYPLHERKHNALHLLETVPATPKTIPRNQLESKIAPSRLTNFGNKSVKKNIELPSPNKQIHAKTISNKQPAFKIQPKITGTPIDISYESYILTKELKIPRNIPPLHYSQTTAPKKKRATHIASVQNSLSEKITELHKIDDS